MLRKIHNVPGVENCISRMSPFWLQNRVDKHKNHSQIKAVGTHRSLEMQLISNTCGVHKPYKTRVLERAKGIEPSYAAWEAAVLPLNYARGSLA